MHSLLDIAPFGRPLDELPVLNEPVVRWRERMLFEHGFEPLGQAYRHPDSFTLRWERDVFVTPAFLRTFLDRARRAERPVVAEVARGCVHEAFGANPTAFGEPGRPRLRYALEAGPESGGAPEALELSWTNAYTRLMQPGRMETPLIYPDEPAFIWSVRHWSDLLVCNLLALTSTISRLPDEVERAGDVQIHPTATVERSRLARGVRIGPYSYVKNSILEEGAVVANHCAVTGCLIGPGTLVQEQAGVRDSVVGPDALVSFRTNVRGSVLFGSTTSSAPAVPRCIVGERTFLSRGLHIASTVIDGSTVWVWHNGRRVDTGIVMLGVAVGQDARIGNVTLPAGYEVPAGYYLAGRAVSRIAPGLPRGQTLVEANGVFRRFGQYLPGKKDPKKA